MFSFLKGSSGHKASTSSSCTEKPSAKSEENLTVSINVEEMDHVGTRAKNSTLSKDTNTTLRKSTSVDSGSSSTSKMDSKKVQMLPQTKESIAKLARLYHVSEKRLQHFYEAFQLFDKNSDGSITASEIDAVMKSLGILVSDEELIAVINKVDVNKNGTIEFEEFLRLMVQHADSQNDADDIKHAFEIFDRDKDGYISSAELSMVMKSIGESFNEADIGNLIKEADKDGDGKVNFEEFQAMLKDDKVCNPDDSLI